MKSLMKTQVKLLTMIASLTGLALTAQAAPLVIGNWQDNDGDGWTDNSDASITNAANMPSKYAFLSGVVAGYAQSLTVRETGYGNNRLKINLTTLGGAIDAFSNGTKMQFTFSCPPDTGAASGFMQIAEVQINSPGSGFVQAASVVTTSMSRRCCKTLRRMPVATTTKPNGSGPPTWARRTTLLLTTNTRRSCSMAISCTSPLTVKTARAVSLSTEHPCLILLNPHLS